ncbi:hypothetical protein GF339_13745 [candidate division KSB3 bacterium]|uniref:Nitroreductase domain-containing protein n=1 Tax=candidate division KSB3 bacterium TaxID=2044937 RepID=A0A9D5JWR6_9BACT|nr:hypothetical protein [candidate division KSB3 bacterium]MBD3325643.1 hypothetical protein [candidate division KSB3 bacterium]
MQFSEILLKRRSIRKYLDQAVDMDLVQEIIHDATFAPSAGNEQPWQFIIVTDTDLLQRISDDCKTNLLARIANNPNDYAQKYQKMLQNPAFQIFYHAPCLIIIGGERHVKNLDVDCTLAASYIMMSATARGLGTCWINFAREITDPEILSQLGLPDTYTIVAPIILGYPAIEPSVPTRKEASIIKIVT